MLLIFQRIHGTDSTYLASQLYLPYARLFLYYLGLVTSLMGRLARVEGSKHIQQRAAIFKNPPRDFKNFHFGSTYGSYVPGWLAGWLDDW